MWTIKTAIGSSWSTWTPHRRTLCLLRRTLCLLPCNSPQKKINMLTLCRLLLITFLMADQKLITVNSSPHHIRKMARKTRNKQYDSPKSANDDLLDKRLEHVRKYWLQEQHNQLIADAFKQEDITTWSDFQSFALDLHVINTKVRNQGGEINNEGEEDNGGDDDGGGKDNYAYISQEWRDHIVHALSFVNELQLRQGCIADGYVDVRAWSYFEFCNFVSSEPDFVRYSNEEAKLYRARRDEEEVRQLKIDKLR